MSRLILAAILLSSLAATAFGAPPAGSVGNSPPAFLPIDHRLELDIRTGDGTPLAARVRILGSDNRVHPDTLDPVRIAYYGGGGYHYADGTTWVNVPPGWTRITVGKGFEWRAFDQYVNVTRDTTLQVVLNRFVDLAPEGWYCGDMHAHTQHEPIDYILSPLDVKMIAKSEGLNVLNLLDQGYQFTGAPHVVSDAETVIYYTIEYRNGAYGHFEIPGLRHMVSVTCCSTPANAYPMIWDTRNELVPTNAPMIILGHPHTTDEYFEDHGWPGSGLGRELPVLAALGGLDAMDVVSYTNLDNFMDFDEWTAILSAGLPAPVSAGTDTEICARWAWPAGGWRVYANVGEGQPLNYNTWVAALKAGRSFVTSYPLLPNFEFGDARPGDVIEEPSDTLSRAVRIRALDSMGLLRISVVADGNTVWSTNLLGGHTIGRSEIDTTVTISITPTPAWIYARAEGVSANPHSAITPSLAATSAIRVTRNGIPIRHTSASGRWLRNLDSLEVFVTNRGNWEQVWMRDSVMARINRSRDYYKTNFVLPPGPFSLLEPQQDDTMIVTQDILRWEPATDPEPGDRITYAVTVARDSLFSIPVRRYRTTDTQISNMGLPSGHWYWRVVAEDWNGNFASSNPRFKSFYMIGTASIDPSAVAITDERPRGVPNPSRDSVRLTGLKGPIEIVDLSGRKVAATGSGVTLSGTSFIWDGKIDGRPAPAGLYWARGSGSAAVIRLIRIK
jgi:hypothetical protein